MRKTENLNFVMTGCQAPSATFSLVHRSSGILVHGVASVEIMTHLCNTKKTTATRIVQLKLHHASLHKKR
jgi:hypothetical protein